MRTCVFKFDDNSDFGPGFTPDWIEGADPSSGMGAAHDVLEHFPNCIGGFEGEMMAFGSIFFIRGNNQDWGRHTIYENLGSDIARFLGAVLSGEQTLKSPGRFSTVGTVEDDIDVTELRHHINKAINECCVDSAWGEYTPTANREKLPADAPQRILGWILKGYRKAHLRFKRAGLQSWRVHEMFEEIRTEFDDALKDEGMPGDQIIVTTDFRTRHVDVKRVTWEDRAHPFGDD